MPQRTSDLTDLWNGQTGSRESLQGFALLLNSYQETGDIQVLSLIYAIGTQAEHIFKSFAFTDDSHKDDFMKESWLCLRPTLNLREMLFVKRCVFTIEFKNPGGSVESFIRVLHALEENYDLRTVKDENITNRLVIWLTSKASHSSYN